jgi:3-mercaptopyruvate sulfurtransferase SseA
LYYIHESDMYMACLYQYAVAHLLFFATLQILEASAILTEQSQQAQQQQQQQQQHSFSTSSVQIVDARSLARFNGESPEPRPGLKSGHIPGSKCVPFTAVLQPSDWTRFKAPDDIKQVG